MLYVFLLIGGGIAVFGFVAMRDPMRFALLGRLNPSSEGYYQRMVLDRRNRLQLRMVGMVTSFFGLMVLMGMLDGELKFKLVHSVSEGFLSLLWLTFISCFLFGLVDAIVQGIRGRGAELMFGWYEMWKQSMELGPVAAFPSFSPRMDKEKIVFTAIYFSLVALTFVLAFLVAAWP
jgi:hypothetical protein